MDTPLSAPAVMTIPLGESPVGAPPPALWNPNAAGFWSILLTPTFGAWLHMKNWQALGEEQRARQSLYWAWGNVATILVFGIIGFLLPESALVDAASRIAGIAVLLGWWQQLGTVQRKFVAARYGTGYPRRGWSIPLGYALLAIVLMCLLAISAVVLDELWADTGTSASSSPRM